MNLKDLKWHGFAHEAHLPNPGELTVTCPACPQPGINLPDDWEKDDDRCVLSADLLSSLLRCISYVYTRGLVMDANFTAVHQRSKYPDRDVYLSDGLGYMTEREEYERHLAVAKNYVDVSGCRFPSLSATTGVYRVGTGNIVML